MPSFNPKDPSDVQDLMQSMEVSRKRMSHARKTRRDMVLDYAGRHYSTEAKKKIPVNMLELAVNVYRRMVAANRPRALVSADSPDLKAAEAEFQVGINDVIEEIDLETKIDRWVLDAMFNWGILKVGLTPSKRQLQLDDYTARDSGILLVETVDLDDWVHDMQARHIEKAWYQGHKVRNRLDRLLDGNFFDGDAKDLLVATNQRGQVQGMFEGEQRVEEISRGGYVGLEEDRRQHTEYWELWLPADGIIVFLPTWRSDVVLKTVEWEGPRWGPYNFLHFGDVPDNTLPLAPVHNIYDLFDLGNHLFRQLGRQAERLKKVTGFRGSAAEDAERLNESNDGDSFHMEDPGGINELQLGGISRETLAMFLQTREQFNWAAGNVDSLAGLDIGAPTATQDQLLSQAASRKIVDMQERVVKATRRVMESIAYWYWDEGPLDQRTIMREVGGIRFPTKLRRDGKFTDYRIKIDPFSMRDESPQQKLAKLNGTVQGLLPLMDILLSQGIIFDVEEYLDEVERLTGLTRLRRIFKRTSGDLRAQPQESAMRPAAAASSGKSSGQKQTGRTAKGQGRVMQDVLLGGSPQANEMAQLVGAA